MRSFDDETYGERYQHETQWFLSGLLTALLSVET